MKTLLVSVLMMAALLVSPAFAEGLLPNIPAALGEPHPEGNEFWRVNHPAILSHDRDLTVQDGIRDIDGSIKTCVACHAVEGPDAAPLTSASPEHSCVACHEYVAVKIDCFQCHNSLPDPDLVKALLMLPKKNRALAAYLKEVTE